MSTQFIESARARAEGEMSSLEPIATDFGRDFERLKRMPLGVRMLESDDMEALAVWKRILAAVEELRSRLIPKVGV